MRGENIPVLLKICYSAANSIPKVLAVSVVIFVLVGTDGTDWTGLDRSGVDCDEMSNGFIIPPFPPPPPPGQYPLSR